MKLFSALGALGFVVAIIAMSGRSYESASLMLLGGGLAAVVAGARRWLTGSRRVVQ